MINNSTVFLSATHLVLAFLGRMHFKTCSGISSACTSILTFIQSGHIRLVGFDLHRDRAQPDWTIQDYIRQKLWRSLHVGTDDFEELNWIRLISLFRTIDSWTINHTFDLETTFPSSRKCTCSDECLYCIPPFHFCARINDDSDEGTMHVRILRWARSQYPKSMSRWPSTDPSADGSPTDGTEYPFLSFLSCSYTNL